MDRNAVCRGFWLHFSTRKQQQHQPALTGKPATQHCRRQRGAPLICRVRAGGGAAGVAGTQCRRRLCAAGAPDWPSPGHVAAPSPQGPLGEPLSGLGVSESRGRGGVRCCRAGCRRRGRASPGECGRQPARMRRPSAAAVLVALLFQAAARTCLTRSCGREGWPRNPREDRDRGSEARQLPQLLGPAHSCCAPRSRRPAAGTSGLRRSGLEKPCR